jgi:hypothetical protein
MDAKGGQRLAALFSLERRIFAAIQGKLEGINARPFRTLPDWFSFETKAPALRWRT